MAGEETSFSLIIAVSNCTNIPTSGDVPELMVFIGPVPVQCLKIDRRVMQKMSFSYRKAEHDSVISYISFKKNGVKS